MTSASDAGILPIRTGLLVVGHGSRRDEANRVLADVADALRPRFHGPVEHAYLEIAAPSIAEGFAALVARACARVVVHPYFLYPGNHTAKDIPGELSACSGDTPWMITEPLNLDDRIVAVVLDRIAEALR